MNTNIPEDQETPPAGDSAPAEYVEREFYLDEFQPERWLFRVPLIVGGIVLIGLLITARSLTPAEQGMGTHRQLGLPQCGFVSMFGVPCPSCGMTTSWAYLTRLRVLAAVQTNPGGTMLGLMAAFFGPWFILSGIFGKWIFKINLKYLLGFIVLVFAVTLGHWLVRIFM